VVEAVAIGSRLVGPGRPCLLIAEVGVNHNGDVELARRLVAAAAEAGAAGATRGRTPATRADSTNRARGEGGTGQR